MSDIYPYQLKTLNGEELSLERFRGQVVLIVNTASRCGFTPQYESLESLHQTYKAQGFSVLACPCNQFGSQEPGSSIEIQNFCSLNYAITFPISEKILVNGKGEHPLFQFLKTSATGVLGTRAIKWNFTKFLIDRHGQVNKRYGPMISPDTIRKDIEHLLKT